MKKISWFLSDLWFEIKNRVTSSVSYFLLIALGLGVVYVLFTFPLKEACRKYYDKAGVIANIDNTEDVKKRRIRFSHTFSFDGNTHDKDFNNLTARTLALFPKSGFKVAEGTKAYLYHDKRGNNFFFGTANETEVIDFYVLFYWQWVMLFIIAWVVIYGLLIFIIKL